MVFPWDAHVELQDRVLKLVEIKFYRVLLLLVLATPVFGLSILHWEKPENQISYAPCTTHYFRGDLAVSHLSSVNYG